MADELPWTHTVHTVTSTVATAALLVAVVVAMPVARRAGWHYGALVIIAGLLTGVGSVWLGVEMGRPYLPVVPPWESMIGAARGRGRGTATLESAVAELSSVVDEAAAGRVALVGHSMWGPVVEA